MLRTPARLNGTLGFILGTRSALMKTLIAVLALVVNSYALPANAAQSLNWRYASVLLSDKPSPVEFSAKAEIVTEQTSVTISLHEGDHAPIRLLACTVAEESIKCTDNKGEHYSGYFSAGVYEECEERPKEAGSHAIEDLFPECKPSPNPERAWYILQRRNALILIREVP